VCLLIVYREVAECLQSVCRVFAQRAQSSYRWCSACVQSVCRVFAECLPRVCRMFAEGLQNASECLQAACLQRFGSVSAVGLQSVCRVVAECFAEYLPEFLRSV